MPCRTEASNTKIWKMFPNTGKISCFSFVGIRLSGRRTKVPCRSRVLFPNPAVGRFRFFDLFLQIGSRERRRAEYGPENACRESCQTGKHLFAHSLDDRLLRICERYGTSCDTAFPLFLLRQNAPLPWRSLLSVALGGKCASETLPVPMRPGVPQANAGFILPL